MTEGLFRQEAIGHLHHKLRGNIFLTGKFSCTFMVIALLLAIMAMALTATLDIDGLAS